jgi:4-hydroxythreonine-4-phosphate dehydrogenase
MTGWIAIACGDITGIGPEVTLKALGSEMEADGPRFLLIGDADCLEGWNDRLHLGLHLRRCEGCKGGLEKEGGGRIFIFNPVAALPGKLAAGSPEAAVAALGWLEEGGRRCLAGEVDALVTAPLSKESILRLGRPFVGQTEFLSEMAGTERTAMMLLGEDDAGRWLRVVLATTHLPLKKVADELTPAKIERAIELGAEACGLLGLGRARVGVCGLNPHAGEGGELGTEEITIIGPAVEKQQGKGLDVTGPHAADTLFHQAFMGRYEVVVAMYHDQGLVPLKMIGFEKGVNWTLGLPFIRTSPDHGTAYDIAGLGEANPSSMKSAIKLARELMRKKAGAGEKA